MLIIAIMLINNRPNCRDNADELLPELTGGVMAEGTQHLINAVIQWETHFGPTLTFCRTHQRHK